VHGGQFIIGNRLEAGQHPDRREGIQRQMLTAGIPATTAMKHALGIQRQAHRCNGIQEGLHETILSTNDVIQSN
jgi:hypothetical protein